jgi:hypothetical protein
MSLALMRATGDFACLLQMSSAHREAQTQNLENNPTQSRMGVLF